MNKAPYMQQVNGAWYWKPGTAAKSLGFSNERLGRDYEAACKRGWGLYEQYLEERRNKVEATVAFEPKRGDFNWLIGEFQRDQVWYGAKAVKTQEDMDRAFRVIGEHLGAGPVMQFNRRHARGFYNEVSKTMTVSASEKVMKWLRRLLTYAVEVGVRDDVPMDRMSVLHCEPRETIWLAEEIEAVLNVAINGFKTRGDWQDAKPRPSIALAVAIAYDTSLPQGDILRLQWTQWDSIGFRVRQQKKRGVNEVYCPVSDRTRVMIEATERGGPFILICEETGQVYFDPPESSNQPRRNAFGRMFRKMRERAGVSGKHFHDIRRTALTAYGAAGATEAQLSKMSGHKIGSKIIDTYVRGDDSYALAAAQKRWGMSSN